jgi:hypothetical protein
MQRSEGSRNSMIFNNSWRATVIANNMYKCQSDKDTVCNVLYTLTAFNIDRKSTEFALIGEYQYCGSSMQVFIAKINDKMKLRVDNGISVKPVSLERLRRELYTTNMAGKYTLDTTKVFKIPEVVMNVQLAIKD